MPGVSICDSSSITIDIGKSVLIAHNYWTELLQNCVSCWESYKCNGFRVNEHVYNVTTKLDKNIIVFFLSQRYNPWPHWCQSPLSYGLLKTHKVGIPIKACCFLVQVAQRKFWKQSIAKTCFLGNSFVCGIIISFLLVKDI